MLYIAFIVLATALLCKSAYKLGGRSDFWSLVLAPILLLAGWRVLLAPAIPTGEGAASGVVVVEAAIWYLGGVCLLLALALLLGSLYARRSTAVLGVLLGIAVPVVLVLGYRLFSGGRAEPAAGTEQVQPATPPRDS